MRRNHLKPENLETLFLLSALKMPIKSVTSYQAEIKWVVINRVLTCTHPHPPIPSQKRVTLTHTHPPAAKKGHTHPHPPTLSLKKVTPTHTQPGKGRTHPHPPKKRSYPPTPTHTHPKKGHTHPHRPTPSQRKVIPT